ncbi:hypothetical protein [Acuticoccus kandeliae]|uniref:hypothetical protein n=1 Tax=Acuticoccus kandeliae TaxID=2073160 RepID=UPI0013006E38|nr:hypothetical protein [Acuticoccus kandeliae]
MSYLTNISMSPAVQPLNAVNTELATQKINATQRPTEPRANTAYWTISGSTQAELTALYAMRDAIVRGGVALERAAGIINSARERVGTIRDTLATAQSSGADRAAAQQVIATQQSQLRAILTGARSQNSAANQQARPDAQGGGLPAAREILAKARTVGATTSAVERIDISALTNSVADLTTLSEYLGIVDAALIDIISQSQLVTTMVARAKSQGSFIAALIDISAFPDPALVEKNLEETAAMLLAIRAKTALSKTDLPIANTPPTGATGGTSGTGSTSGTGGTGGTVEAPVTSAAA